MGTAQYAGEYSRSGSVPGSFDRPPNSNPNNYSYAKDYDKEEYGAQECNEISEWRKSQKYSFLRVTGLCNAFQSRCRDEKPDYCISDT